MKIKSSVEEIADITIMTIEEYKRRVCNDNGPGLVPPAISTATNFELKCHILTMLNEKPFFQERL